MKKLYSTLGVIALFATAAVAQNGRATSPLQNSHPVNQQGKVITNPSPAAAGDTVWIYDGFYTYDWNNTLPGTYAVATEDIDNLTINSAYAPYYGTTGSYVTFYQEDSTATNLHYGHADSVFYRSATSWFASPGQSDDWLEFGPVHVPASGGNLSWMHNYWSTNFRDGYLVLINTVGLASTNYTDTVFSVTDNDPSTSGDVDGSYPSTFFPRSVDVSAYAGQDIYIAFRHYAYDMDVLNLTNIMLIEAGSTGVKESSSFVIGNIMPNPAVGAATITYKLDKASAVNFVVTDLMGKVVYSQNLGNQSAGGHHLNLNTSSFANGMYNYTFEINGQKVSRKFVVNN